MAKPQLNNTAKETKTVTIRGVTKKSLTLLKVYAAKHDISMGEAMSRLIAKGLRA